MLGWLQLERLGARLKLETRGHALNQTSFMQLLGSLMQLLGSLMQLLGSLMQLSC